MPRDAEIERLRSALKQCADLIEDHYFEGDKEYQVVIIARSALKEEVDHDEDNSVGLRREGWED